MDNATALALSPFFLFVKEHFCCLTAICPDTPELVLHFVSLFSLKMPSHEYFLKVSKNRRLCSVFTVTAFSPNQSENLIHLTTLRPYLATWSCKITIWGRAHEMVSPPMWSFGLLQDITRQIVHDKIGKKSVLDHLKEYDKDGFSLKKKARLGDILKSDTICLKSTSYNINLINHPKHQIFIHIHATVVKVSLKARRPCDCPFNKARSTYYKGSFYPYKSASLHLVHQSPEMDAKPNNVITTLESKSPTTTSCIRYCLSPVRSGIFLYWRALRRATRLWLFKSKLHLMNYSCLTFGLR